MEVVQEQEVTVLKLFWAIRDNFRSKKYFK